MESTMYFLKFLLFFLLILALIFIATLLTPKIAARVDKIIDKIFKKNPARVDDDIYKVRSIYDAPPKEDKNIKPEISGNNKENNDKEDVKNGKE